MRPNLFLGCLWALCSCALLSAQTNDQRPSGLRDAGVITRATPSPTNFPAAPATEPTSTSLGDRAWTSTPTRPPTGSPAGRLTDAPISPAAPSHVIPAQFTTNQGSVNQGSGLNTQPNPGGVAVRQAPGNTTATHEPKPLKPPSSSESKADGKSSTGTVQMFISVLSSLAIVIGLILASAWFYRKAAPSINGALPKQVVQVLGRTPLAPRQQLVLLRLGSKLVLVSNLHGEVRTISEITDPLEVDRLSGLCEAAQPGSISESFRSVLHNIGRNG